MDDDDDVQDDKKTIFVWCCLYGIKESVEFLNIFQKMKVRSSDKVHNKAVDTFFLLDLKRANMHNAQLVSWLYFSAVYIFIRKHFWAHNKYWMLVTVM